MPAFQQSPAQNAQARDQLRNDIRQSVTAATDAAREAAQNARVAADAEAQNVKTRTLILPTPPAPPGFSYSTGSGFGNNHDIPPQVTDIAIGFFIMCGVMVIGWPIARALGRRIERRGAEPAAVAPQLTDQLQRIEQAVDAMSIEIERISESQRFIARLQSQNSERVPQPTDRG